MLRRKHLVFSLLLVIGLGFLLGIPNAKAERTLPLYDSNILINGNAELNAFCSGNGTDGSQGNPHVIEDMDIIAGGSQNGIQIVNTTLYLIIRNVNASEFKITGDSKGIFLQNVTHVTLDGCHFVNNSYGMYFENTNFTHIIDSAATTNLKTGILLLDSFNNSFYNTVALHNDDQGLELFGSDYNFINYSLFLENGKYGLLLNDSFYNEVTNCIFLFNAEGCFTNPTDPENTNYIHGNTCRDNTIPGVPVWTIFVIFIVTLTPIIWLTTRKIRNQKKHS